MSNENYGFSARQLNDARKVSGVTASHLAQAATLLRFHGTGKHLALAMYLAKGAVQKGKASVESVTGDTQVNAFGEMVSGGFAKAVDAPKVGGMKVYRFTLTGKVPPKAAAKAAAAKVTAKATGKGKATPKGKGKRRAPKVTAKAVDAAAATK